MAMVDVSQQFTIGASKVGNRGIRESPILEPPPILWKKVYIKRSSERGPSTDESNAGADPRQTAVWNPAFLHSENTKLRSYTPIFLEKTPYISIK